MPSMENTASKPAEKRIKRRPITRKFWNWIRYLPSFVRKQVVRAQFDADYALPSNVILKQAETEEEISQAMKLVHDSYVELGYMDPTKEQLRFNKYLALPTTIILVAKVDEEVIGTISIVPDSALGIPCDLTWDLTPLRQGGRFIGEVSSLAINNKYKMRRGKLLLPLCKLMWEFASKVYNLDTLVIATTVQVEPFYTDILLFEKYLKKSGQKHDLVKGNPSTCYYLDLISAPKKYADVYSDLPDEKNLHQFFVEYQMPNIKYPQNTKSIHGQLLFKNLSIIRLLEKHDDLASAFTDKERLILSNQHIHHIPNVNFFKSINRDKKRVHVNEKAWIFIDRDKNPIPARILDVSADGFHALCRKSMKDLPINQPLVMVFQVGNRPMTCTAEVRWLKDQFHIGCQVVGSTTLDWRAYLAGIWNELQTANPEEAAKHIGAPLETLQPTLLEPNNRSIDERKVG